jgi:hypothetical protein
LSSAPLARAVALMDVPSADANFIADLTHHAMPLPLRLLHCLWLC